MVEDVAGQAGKAAAAALANADVAADEWKEFHLLLDGDPDNWLRIQYACTAPPTSKL
jgi:hypothetical protein